jgi:Ser/Thr protein kinase RdoA (MazF antagonist)
VTGPQDIASALTAWIRHIDSVTPLPGGWNSSTWLVVTPGGRYVAKLADHSEADSLVSSLEVATFAAARGLACGPPVPTSRGALTVSLPAGQLALLHYVPGARPDLAVPGQVRRAGRVLASAHKILADFPAGRVGRYQWPWEWVTRGLATIAMPARVRAAARDAWTQIVDAVDARQLSVGLIHADPGPDSFLLNDAGPDALIDWATTLRGPLLYDLASFAVTASEAGPDAARWFTDAYARDMPQIAPELPCLGYLIKARWVANAIYFSHRIEHRIQRGPAAAYANREGLAAAYQGLIQPPG